MRIGRHPGREARRTSARSAPRGEDALITWLRNEAGSDGHLLGDDAALLSVRRAWAVTVDSQIEGVHFPPGLPARVLARRLLAVNLSDLAAMGALPRYALLALAAPADFPHRPFLRALLAACHEHDIELAGGDICRHRIPSLCLTLLGSRARGGRWLRRGAGKPGDQLWVGGTLGESALGRHLLARGAAVAGGGVRLPSGLPRGSSIRTAARRAIWRHLLPSPQLALGARLGRRPRAACIDLSDGLARDLPRLCRESGTGARVDVGALPLSAEARELARSLGLDPVETALAGGEDYVLLFSLPPKASPPRSLPCWRIGELTKASRIMLVREGSSVPLRPHGWDHLDPRADDGS